MHRFFVRRSEKNNVIDSAKLVQKGKLDNKRLHIQKYGSIK